MALVSLADLRTQSRNRSDMRINGIFTDADFNAAINSSIAELRDLQIKAYGENYFVTGSIVPLQAGVTSYPLPSDHYKLLGVDWRPSQDSPWQSLQTFEFKERNRFANIPTVSTQCSTNARYCLQGQALSILPTPQDGQQTQIWYVPQASRLVSDTDTAEFQNGWEEFVVLGAAIKALVAEESDASAFMAQKMEVRQRIEDMAPNRDITEPHQMIDVERCQVDEGWW